MRHSQRANEPLLNPWIKTDNDGMVLCGHCDCMAGLGEVCSHVGALLFYVEAMRRTYTCTELPCPWNIPPSVDSIQCAKTADINFTAPQSIIAPTRRGAHVHSNCPMIDDPAEIELPISSHPTAKKSTAINPNMIAPTEDQKVLFYSKIASHKPSCLSLIPPFSDSYIPQPEVFSSAVPPLSASYCSQNEELTYKELLHLCDEFGFNLNDGEIADIEQATRGQSESDEWFAHRAGRVTSSKMKAVCHSDPANPSVSLIKQICYPHLFRFSSQATKWGCDHESVGREMYITAMEESHNEFYCVGTGLVIHEEYQFLAATPDGITHCSCCGYGVLEVKCPFCTKDSDPDTAKFLNSGSLQRNHQYYYQVQTQMFVCEVEFADFVVCTFPNDTATINIERIYLDEDFLVESIVQAGQFYTVAILPELLGKWYTRSDIMPSAVVNDSTSAEYNYCYCKAELGGTMICCENDECSQGQWFHLTCLKLQSAPRCKKWYCPHCRKLQNKYKLK